MFHLGLMYASDSTDALNVAISYLVKAKEAYNYLENYENEMEKADYLKTCQSLLIGLAETIQMYRNQVSRNDPDQ